jgi:hypothetical protein
MRRLVVVVALGSILWAAVGTVALVPAVPIPGMPGQDAGDAFIGRAVRARPVDSFRVPRHPFMAPNGRSNMHNDAYMTDAYRQAGPLGRDTHASSTWLGIEECASIAFDARDRIVGLCGTIDGARLRLLEPTTLETLAVMPLPPRSVRPGTTPLNDFCAAGYFYLDDRDRAVVSTNNNQVWILRAAEPTFEIVRTYDLLQAVPPPDCLASVLPDWTGRLWFLSKGGIVGTIAHDSGAIATMAFGEGVANSFAVDETGGVFIVTDTAFYRLEADATGAPRVTWRQPYDRGTQVKPGMLSQGSGTSPTLFGRGLVAIADNADPRMNVLVYRRATGRFVCSEPVFARGASTTENSIIAVGNSLIVENNYGYMNPLTTAQGGSTEPGIVRVDVDPRRKECRTVWESDEISPTTVPKASMGAGLVYVYTKPPRADGVDAWYFTAIDLRTGRTVYKVLTGTGYLHNNHYAPVSIGPDGAAYVGALGGLIRIADGS